MKLLGKGRFSLKRIFKWITPSDVKSTMKNWGGASVNVDPFLKLSQTPKCFSWTCSSRFVSRFMVKVKLVVFEKGFSVPIQLRQLARYEV
jgi:hypothetical protein